MCCCSSQAEDEEDTQDGQEEKDDIRPGKLQLSFEELERQRVEGVRKKAEEGYKRRMQEERRAFAEARKSMVSITLVSHGQTVASHKLQRLPSYRLGDGRSNYDYPA